MKKLSIFLLLLFQMIIVNSQSWSFKKGGDVFDGTYKTSSVIGRGDKFPYTKPMFVINVFKGETEDPNIYITEVPSAVCSNNRVLIKFDNDDYTFTPRVTSSEDHEFWFLHFYGLDFGTNSQIRKDTILEPFNILEYKIEPGAKVVFRTESNPNANIILTLNKEETIEIFNHDSKTGYWSGKYKDSNGKEFLGFINDLFISDLKTNAKETSRIIRYPIIKEYIDPNLKNAGQNQELIKFINGIKSHKTMYIRLLSDCIKSDLEFSLNGSTTAINFVFSK
jgi:hypothetical protein